MLTLKDPSLLKSDAYVDGAWLACGSRFAVTNPATGKTIAEVADLTDVETRRAIEAASRAFPAWRKKTAKERANILRKWFELIMANQEDLAQLMTAEQGKPLAETRGEVAYGASFIEWFAEEGKRIYGDVIPTTQAGRRIFVFKEPIGVVAAVTPWNFPNAMITRKCAPALAAGCTFVIKPAEDTPLSALALAELAGRAGIPAGVFNVVTTSQPAKVGGELTQNPLVRKFSFTGSTEIGKLLMRQCASTVKKVSLELGGNAPFIVFDDADLEAAADGAMLSKFRNMGQTCVCANRFLVQDGIYDAFAEKLAQPHGQAQDRRRHGRRGDPRPADQHGRRREGGAAPQGRHRQRCEDRDRRQARRAGRHVFRADASARRHVENGLRARGNLRARRHAFPFRHRRRRDPHGQRHGIRSRRLLLFEGHGPHHARGMTAIWSPETKFRIWFEIEAHAATRWPSSA
jgi:hypothetical protein